MDNPLPMAPLQTSEARELGDLALIVQDLRGVIDTCTRLLDELRCEPTDSLLVESLWTAALVRYVRCFTSGKRVGLTEDILMDFPEDTINAHRYFKDMRDKHVAHSVNPFEEVVVGVVLAAAGDTVEGTAVLSRKLICTDAEGVRTLRHLAAEVHKIVAERAKSSQARLLEWAQKKPIGDFTISSVGLVTPGSDHAKAPRK